MLDGLEAGTLDDLHHAAGHVRGARVVDAKARWLGHKLQADVAIDVDPALPHSEAKAIAEAVRAELFEHLPALGAANVRFANDDDRQEVVSQGTARGHNRVPGHRH